MLLLTVSVAPKILGPIFKKLELHSNNDIMVPADFRTSWNKIIYFSTYPP
jgi:hypothetical protein